MLDSSHTSPVLLPSYMSLPPSTTEPLYMLGCLEWSSPPPFPLPTPALPSDLFITLAFQVSLFLSSETLPLLSTPRRCPQVVRYGCESWTIKKAERRRIDALELWRWRRLLRVPWTAGRSKQSILKEISPEYYLEALLLKLKLQYFGYLKRTTGRPGVLRFMGSQRVGYDWATDLIWCIEMVHWKSLWCWERLRAGGEGDDRGWDGWMASLTQWTWAWVNSGSWWWTGRPGVLQYMGLHRVGHDWATELTELKVYSYYSFILI